MISTNAPVLILGARSDMAFAIAKVLAKRGHPLMLAARNSQSIAANQSDLKIRYEVEVTIHDFDITNMEGHSNFLDGLPHVPQIVICAVGVMGDQEEDVLDIEAFQSTAATNYIAPALFLEEAARRIDAAGLRGSVVGISSVAGDRGRARNYIYGSAKAGFSEYLSGMRQKYARGKVHVMTVKPGFVRTKMTEGMDLPGPLTADPDEFAQRVVSAMLFNKMVYYDLRWRIVMTIIKMIPESIFSRLKF